jgi:hypothetical protein
MSVRERTGKIIDKSIVLVGGLALLANQSKTPESWSNYVADHIQLQYALLIVVGVVGALTPAEAYAVRSRGKERPKLQRKLLIGLGDFIALAEKRVKPPVGIEDVGLHSWAIKRTWSHPIGGVLKRTGTYRVGGSLLTVGDFAPTKGIGVVGLCWKYNRESHYNVEGLATKLTTAAEFEAYRRTHGDESVMGFSWKEFDEVKHRGAVFAAPIRNGNRFVGCFSVDSRHGYDALLKAGIVELLNTFAQGFDGRDLDAL